MPFFHYSPTASLVALSSLIGGLLSASFIVYAILSPLPTAAF